MNKIKIGKIVNTHGLKGELKVSFDDIELFTNNMELFIEVRGDYKPFTLTAQRMHKNHLLIKLDDYNDINDIEKYKGNDIYITRSEEEVYYSDLIGYSVIKENKEEVGIVENIINNNAHDIFVLDNSVMIPYVEEFIIEIDDEAKTIVANIIEGLIDED